MLKINSLFFIFPIFFFQSVSIFASLLSVVALTVFSILQIRSPIVLSKKVVLPLFLVILILISNMILHESLEQLLHLTFYIKDGQILSSISLFIIFYFLIKRSKSDPLIYFISGVSMLLIISIPYNYFFVHSTPFFHAFFSSHNASAGLVGCLILTVIYLRYYTSIKPYFFTSNVFILLLFFLFILSNSRAFLLALIPSLFYFYLSLNVKLSIIKYVKILLYVILIFALILYFNYDRIIDSFSGFDYNVNTRFFLYKVALESFIDNPIFGIGFGLFNDTSFYKLNLNHDPQIYSNFIYGDLHSHNQLLQLLSELGIFGALVFFVIFYLSFYLPQSHRLLVRGLFIYLFISSFFGLSFSAFSPSVFFYFILAYSIKYYGFTHSYLYRLR